MRNGLLPPLEWPGRLSVSLPVVEAPESAVGEAALGRTNGEAGETD
jgi:hypothetical protein